MTRLTLRTGLLWLTCAVIVGWCVWSATSGGIVAAMFSTELEPAEKLERLKQFFTQFGVLAPLVYVLFVTTEVVVAPLPGAMLYAPGGIIFGAFWGGLLSLIGNVIGAGIACRLMRSVFGGRASGFFETRALKSREEAIARRGVLVVFLLRLNPLTSSDIVSYATGLTSMPTWKVMLGTALGMAPLCWVQAWLADELLRTFPQLLYPLLVLCGIYVVAVGWILKRVIQK